MDELIKSTQKACNLLFNVGIGEDGSIGPLSRTAIDNFKNKLKTIFGNKHYVWSTNNLIGIRMSDEYTDQFTDLGVIIMGDTLFSFPMSTKPGIKYLDHPENAAGCSCLKEGQYINMWQFKDVYGGWTGDPYCQQIHNCTVYREVNHGKSINRNATTDTGIFGINFHSWKGFEGEHVYNLSAGCQVMDEHVIKELITYLEHFFLTASITYTLIRKEDFI